MKPPSSSTHVIQAVPGVTGPLVIRIGVTGHKSFVDGAVSGDGEAGEAAARVERRLRRKVEAVLDYLDSLLINTPRSYCVLSPLAEGSDIIITDIILKHRPSERRLPEPPTLQLILPMPEEIYLTEFKSEEYQTAFLVLKDAAVNKPAAPLLTKVLTKGDRSHAYERVTHEVADGCDILIAAWDGSSTGKPAGTAATVKEARSLGKPVVHILTPRLNQAELRPSLSVRLWEAAERLLLPLIPSRRAAPGLFRAFGIYVPNGKGAPRDSPGFPKHADGLNLDSLKNLDGFNEDLQSLTRSSGRTGINLKDPEGVATEVGTSYESIRKSLSEPSGEPGAAQYFEETFGHDLKQVLLPIWKRSARLARQYQQRYNRWIGTAAWILAASAVVTVSAIVSLASFFPFINYFYWLEVIEAVSILFIIWLSWYFEWHRKRIEYRMLSERLRATIFLYIAGEVPKRLTLPPYFRAGPHTAEWVIKLFNSLTEHMRSSMGTTPVEWPRPYFKSLRNLLAESWLEDQLQYYERQHKRQHRLHNILEVAALLMFGLTIVIAVIHAMEAGHEESALTAALNILALSLPALGGSIGGILTHREYRRNARRYQHMFNALQPLVLKAKSAEDFGTLKGILLEAHELMLREQQSWLLTVGVEPTTPA